MSFIPVNEPLFIGNEKKYLNDCIDTGWISSAGSYIKEFEALMAKTCDRKYASNLSSGTAALEIALKVLNLEPNDEVIVPSFTIISCVNAVIKVGAKPVLVDSSIETFNTDIGHIESKITANTKAIILPHIYCFPIDLDPILDLCKSKGIYVIEDAAEMNGQKYKGRPCGSFGDISIFSFYANKHVTTGEGGMLLTNNEEFHLRTNALKDHAFMSGRRFVHNEVAYNFRMTNLQAAVGLAQLECLDQFITKKQEMAKIYNDYFADNKFFDITPINKAYARNIYWVYPLILKKENNEEVMQKLVQKGIGSRPFFWPMHQQPIYQEMGLFKNESYPGSEYLAKRGLYIPSGLGISNEQIHHCAKTILEVINE